jgi:hypothetical protein
MSSCARAESVVEFGIFESIIEIRAIFAAKAKRTHPKFTMGAVPLFHDAVAVQNPLVCDLRTCL